MPPKAVVELRIPSTFGSETGPMEKAASIARKMGFPTARVDALRTAVGEACLNAIEHGNQQNASKEVVITLTQYAASLQVDVDDQGPGIKTVPQHPPNLHKKMAGKERPRGWGLYLMHRLVDEVQLKQRAEGGNRTRLIIHA